MYFGAKAAATAGKALANLASQPRWGGTATSSGARPRTRPKKALATCSGDKGCARVKLMAASAWSTWRASMGVSTASGQTTVTAMPWGLSSCATASEKPRTANFEAV
jgi:hypothetical protein